MVYRACCSGFHQLRRLPIINNVADKVISRELCMDYECWTEKYQKLRLNLLPNERDYRIKIHGE